MNQYKEIKKPPAAPVGSGGVRPGRKKSPDSLETLKPWVKEGLSRTVWYARKRERELIEADRKSREESEKNSDWDM